MKYVYWIFIILVILDVLAILFLFIYRKKSETVYNKEKIIKFHSFIKIASIEDLKNQFRKNWKSLLLQYVYLQDYFSLSGVIKEKMILALRASKRFVEIYRLLNSNNKVNQKMAAHFLSALDLKEAGPILIHTLKRQKFYSIKLVIISTLIDLDIHAALPDIIDSLIGAPKTFQQRVSRMVKQFGESIIHYFPILEQRNETEIKLFLINYGQSCPSLPLYDYLLKLIFKSDNKVARKAFFVLLKNYRKKLDSRIFLEHDDLIIQRMAIEALGEEAPEGNTDIIVEYLNKEVYRNSAVLALSKRMKLYPHIINELLEGFYKCQETSLKNALARAFSNRIEYVLYRIISSDREKIQALVENLLEQGYTSGIITFLNSNHNLKIEKAILESVGNVLKRKPELINEFSLYLMEALLKKLNLEPLTHANLKPKKKGIASPGLLILFLISVLAIYPVLFLIEKFDIVINTPFLNWINILVLRANYYFVFYSLVINGIYIILLFLSFLGGSRLRTNRLIKPKRFLWKEGILPNISILCPAYCEEANIVESVNSLLNLDYPDYEVIVVNDGSTDKTLEKLINTFKLEKIDAYYKTSLKTNLIRGVYKCKWIPRLTVIDKRNGGKADSLNAGINWAKGDYCCVIDADCILELTALVETVSIFLDQEEDVTASGGIVLPANGCLVKKGYVVRRKVSRKFLPSMQTIEYIRSFIAGRLGWSTLKGLSIISGAFGLFHRKQLLYARGYLTSKEFFDRDTVGEDMELVVRLMRLVKRRTKKKAVINYSPYAVCWTEVPAKAKILLSQRNRWQRGLIETISIHSGVLFNPHYGNYGLLAFPYFLIFEILGPWIEMQGYLFFITGLFMGILNWFIILIVFLVSIFFGIYISLGSLLLSDRIRPVFSKKDLIYLLLLSVLENFGFRQLMNLTRVFGYTSAIRKKHEWGFMQHQGFGDMEVQDG